MVRCKLVGINFAKPKRHPRENDAVKLKLEPDNLYDKDAIAVFYDKEKIGYIATDNTTSAGNRKNGCITNKELKPLIDFKNDNSYSAIITKERGWFGFLDIKINI